MSEEKKVPGSNMKVMLKQALPMLKSFGLDLDDILQNSLGFLPDFFNDKIAEYKNEDPDLDVVIMITSEFDKEKQEDELWLVPVGTKWNEDGQKVTIEKEYKPLNLNVFLKQLNIEEMLNKEDEKSQNNDDQNNHN